MHEENIDRIIRTKLQGLEVSLNPRDWDAMCQALNDAFEASLSQKLKAYTLPMEASDWANLQSELNLAFDELIRQKLSQWQLPYEPADWAQLAARLSANPLDISFVSSLQAMELPLAPPDWDRMAASLDADPLDTAFREKLEAHAQAPPADAWEQFEAFRHQQFDQDINEKLAGHQVPADKADWSKLAAQLDDSPFDNLIREKLSTHQVPFQSKDWGQMEEKLHAPLYALLQAKIESIHLTPHARDWRAMQALMQAHASRKLWYQNWRSYVSAAAIALLFLWTFMGIPSPQANEQLAQVENNQSHPVTTDATDVPTPLHAGLTQTESQIAAASSTAQESSVASQPGPVQTQAHSLPAHQALVSKQPDQANQSSDQVAPLEPRRPAHLVNLAEPLPDQDGIQLDESAAPPPPNKREPTLRRMEHFTAFATPWSPKLESRKKGIHKWIRILRRRGPEVKVGLYGATSHTKVELNASESTPGFKTGVRVELKVGQQLSVISGLNYGKMGFRHEGFSFGPDGQRCDNFTQAQLKVFEAPILLRYYFPSNNDLKLYAQVGAVTVLALEEDYAFQNECAPSNQGRLSSSVRGFPAQVHERNFNTYPGNISASLGLAYDIHDQLSLNIEPYAQLSLQRTKGSGTLNIDKKMYSVGLGVGLLYGFKKKDFQ